MKVWYYVFIVTFFVLLPQVSEAATLYMDPREAEVFPGDTLAVALRLDTDEGECVNVVDAVIVYDPEIVAVDVSRGESIMPLWVEDPIVDSEQHTITFAGGIPNGYCGRIAGDPRLTNVLAELIFQVPGLSINIGNTNDGVASIEWSESTAVYRNADSGEQAPLAKFGTNLAVGTKPRGEVHDEWNPRVQNDNLPPREFTIALSADSSIFNGKYFVTFNTTDKESGLDHYEIIEEPLDALDLFGWGGVDAPWLAARSPYLLDDQTLNSVIRVKAIDKAGNEYIAVYLPPEETRQISQRTYLQISLAVVGSLVIFMTLGLVIRHRLRVRSERLAKSQGVDPIKQS